MEFYILKQIDWLIEESKRENTKCHGRKKDGKTVVIIIMNPFKQQQFWNKASIPDDN